MSSTAISLRLDGYGQIVFSSPLRQFNFSNCSTQKLSRIGDVREEDVLDSTTFHVLDTIRSVDVRKSQTPADVLQ